MRIISSRIAHSFSGLGRRRMRWQRLRSSACSRTISMQNPAMRNAARNANAICWSGFAPAIQNPHGDATTAATIPMNSEISCKKEAPAHFARGFKLGVKDGIDESCGFTLRAATARLSPFTSFGSNPLAGSTPEIKKAPTFARGALKLGVKDGIRTRGLLNHNQAL